MRARGRFDGGTPSKRVRSRSGSLRATRSTARLLAWVVEFRRWSGSRSGSDPGGSLARMVGTPSYISFAVRGCFWSRSSRTSRTGGGADSTRRSGRDGSGAASRGDGDDLKLQDDGAPRGALSSRGKQRGAGVIANPS